MMQSEESFIAGGKVSSRPKNWPPWPKSIIHHDIDGEILDPVLHTYTTYSYYGWFAFIVALLWNFIICLTLLIVSVGHISDLILSIIYPFTLPLAAFYVYFLLYSSSRQRKRRSSFAFMTFYCLFGTQIAAEILFSIGIPYVGSGGLVYMIQSFNKNQVAVGIMNLISLLVWVGLAGFHAFIWVQLRRFHYPASEVSDDEQRAGLTANADGYGNEGYGAGKSDLLAEGEAAYQSRDFHVADTPDGLEKVEYDTELPGQVAAVAGKVAYDNREYIAQTAYDNREQIAGFAARNSDAVAGYGTQFANSQGYGAL